MCNIIAVQSVNNKNAGNLHKTPATMRASYALKNRLQKTDGIKVLLAEDFRQSSLTLPAILLFVATYAYPDGTTVGRYVVAYGFYDIKPSAALRKDIGKFGTHFGAVRTLRRYRYDNILAVDGALKICSFAQMFQNVGNKLAGYKAAVEYVVIVNVNAAQIIEERFQASVHILQIVHPECNH